MSKIVFISNSTSPNLEILSQLRIKFPDHEIFLQEKRPGDATVGDLPIYVGRIEENKLDNLIREQVEIKANPEVKYSPGWKEGLQTFLTGKRRRRK